MASYETNCKTRLYADVSPVGTQATVAQQHKLNDELVWRPVNHTSRCWTPAESRYGQIERESNGLLTGMLMNKMYTLGTQVEVVTDHEPLLPIYSSSAKPRQLRVDRHRTKLLPYDFTVVHEPGVTSPCDYGSRHPSAHNLTGREIEEWGVETGTGLLPQTIGMSELQEATSQDSVLTKLISCIGQSECGNDKQLKPFKQIFSELWTCNGILMRNGKLDKIVIPPSLYALAIETAHKWHQYTTKTLQLLRQTARNEQTDR